MTLPDHAHAPGCFGSALTYREGTPECSTCEFAANCAPVSQQRLMRLRERYGVQIGTKRQRDRAKAVEIVAFPPEVPAEVALTLPVKVRELLARIEKHGIRVTAALREGKNPFAWDKLAFLYVACFLLLRRGRHGVDLKELTLAFKQKLDWNAGTAAAHVSQTVQALKALGAADFENGRLQLRNFA